MTAEEERKFDIQCEKHFRGQRTIPNGRDFMWNYYHREKKETRDRYKKNFDNIDWGHPTRAQRMGLSI